MNVELAYGEGTVNVDFPENKTTVISPTHIPGLTDEKAAIMNALSSPTGSQSLLNRVSPSDKICILFTDITRATPNHKIIPWILEHLKDHPKENIILLNQLGTHRPNTKEELERDIFVLHYDDTR